MKFACSNQCEHAFIAQGLERWSSKPEVGSSILPEGRVVLLCETDLGSVHR